MTSVVDRPAASVIVLAYNASALIRRALDALQRQRCDEPFEVIVVWSGDPETAEIAAREFPAVRVVGQPARLYTGATRNLGIAHARGEIIIFLAADCLPAPEWVAQRLAAHRDGHRLVGGAVLCAEPAGWLARANHFVEYALSPPGRPREVVRHRPLYNLSFTRDIFEQYGFYDATLIASEDSRYNWQLIRAGEAVLFDPSVQMFHPGPTTVSDYLWHQFAHGRAFGALYQRADYPGPRYRGPFAFLTVCAYPFVRFAGVWRWTSAWNRANRWQLVRLMPVAIAGLLANTAGLAREWRTLWRLK